MSNLINIWNPNTGDEVVTLLELKERLCSRRMNALSPSVKKEYKKQVTVMTTDPTLQQVAAHYKSFEIRQFHIDKAIKVFNEGGCQKATIIIK